jgi:signal transduction histidine kinase
VEVAGGELEIITEPGQGCRMVIEVPYLPVT